MEIKSKYTTIDGDSLVDSGYLTTLIETMLNEEASLQKKDVTFKLYDGYGEIKKAQRAGNYVEFLVHGIASTQRGQRENINGLDMYAATTNVELMVPVARDGVHEDKFYAFTVRDVCNAAALRYNSAVYHDASISYSVSIAASGAVLGDFNTDAALMTGDYISVLFSVGFGIFAKGVNGSDITLKVNGMELHKNALVKTRAKSAESVQQQGGRHTREVILQDGMSFDLTGPLTTDDVGRWLMDEIDGEHDLNAPIVVYERKMGVGTYIDRAYLMTAANSSYTGEPNINGGYSLSLVEILCDVAFGALAEGCVIPGAALFETSKEGRVQTVKMPGGKSGDVTFRRQTGGEAVSVTSTALKLRKVAIFYVTEDGELASGVYGATFSSGKYSADIKKSVPEGTPVIVAIVETEE